MSMSTSTTTFVVVNSIFAGLFLTGCVRTKDQPGNSTGNCMVDKEWCGPGLICVKEGDSDTSYMCVGCDAGTYWQDNEITYPPGYTGPVNYCVNPCADGYWGDDDDSNPEPDHVPQPICRGCDSKCATCEDGNSCTSCPEGTFLFNGDCITADDCTLNYGYTEDGVCKSCHVDENGLRSCGTCNGPTETSCLTCPGSLFVGGQDNIYMTPFRSCVTEYECKSDDARKHPYVGVPNEQAEPYTCDDSCSEHTNPVLPYQTDKANCVDDCGKAVIEMNDRCVFCPNPTPYRYTDGSCIDECPATYFADISGDEAICQKCTNDTCLYCEADGRCTECKEGLNLTEDGTCVTDDDCTDPTLPVCNECPEEFPLRIPGTGACTDQCTHPTWADVNNICQDCLNEDCTECNPADPNTCLACPDELNLTEGGLCVADEECMDEDILPDFCEDCPEGLLRLPNDICVTECPGDFYQDGDFCLPCTNETTCELCAVTPEQCSTCPPGFNLTEDWTCISDEDCADPELPRCEVCPEDTFRTVIGTCVADCGLATIPAQCEECIFPTPHRTLTGRCVDSPECGILQTGDQCVTCPTDRFNRTQLDSCVPDPECESLRPGDQCKVCPADSLPNRTELGRCVVDALCEPRREGDQCLECPANSIWKNETELGRCVVDAQCEPEREGDQCLTCPLNSIWNNETELGRCVVDAQCEPERPGDQCLKCPDTYPNLTEKGRCVVDVRCTSLTTGDECVTCPDTYPNRTKTDRCVIDEQCSVLTTGDECVDCPNHQEAIYTNRTETGTCVTDFKCTELFEGEHCTTCPRAYPFRVLEPIYEPKFEFFNCDAVCPNNYNQPDQSPHDTITPHAMTDDVELVCTPCIQAGPSVHPCLRCDLTRNDIVGEEGEERELGYDRCISCQQDAQFFIPVLEEEYGICVTDCDAYPDHVDCGVVVDQIETVFFLDDSGSMKNPDFRLDMGLRVLESLAPHMDGRPVRVHKFGTNRHLLTPNSGRTIGLNLETLCLQDGGKCVLPHRDNRGRLVGAWNGTSDWTYMWKNIREDVPDYYLPGPGLLRVYIIADGVDNSNDGRPNGFEGFEALLDDLEVYNFNELQFHYALIDGPKDSDGNSNWEAEYTRLANRTGGSFVHYHRDDRPEDDAAFARRMSDMIEKTIEANERYDRTEDNTPGAGNP